MLCKACLWDRDTLDQDVVGKEGVLRAIVGYFDQNPPLYYSMRLTRIEQLEQEHRASLDDLDTAAVACERLGNSDAAIAWMERKRKRLSKNSPSEAWYRYHANLGTFYIHRWFRAGAKHRYPDDLNLGLRELLTAVEVNPNAHFGREWVQIGLAAAMLRKYDRYAVLSREAERSLGRLENPRASEGLAGLVTLGSAWESPDVFGYLHTTLYIRNRSLAHLAALRSRELEAQGKKSLFEHNLPTQVPTYLEVAFATLRREGDAYRAERIYYMTRRLEAGRHPDTDPYFWNEFHPRPLTDPASLVPLSARIDAFFSDPGRRFFVGFAAIAACAVALFLLVNARRRRRLRSLA